MSDDQDDRDDASDDGADVNLSASAWRSAAPDGNPLFTPRGMPVQPSDELERVLALPRRPIVTEGSPTALALIDIGMQRYGRAPRDPDAELVARDAELEGKHDVARRLRGCHCAQIREHATPLTASDPCLTRLNWIQAWAMHEINVANGLIASIAVGGGKTSLDLLAPLALRNCPTCLLLIPPSLVEQIKLDYLCLAEHFHVPRIAVHESGKYTWRPDPDHHTNRTDAPILHVLPYSQLSSVDSSSKIDNLCPDAIIADECDSLKDMGSARTMRLMRHFQNHGDTRFCGWTGSLTDSSISEYAHLACLALRERSPLPIVRDVIDEWGRCLDAVPSPCPPGALIRFLEVGEDDDLSSVRRAYKRRTAQTLGFVMVEGRQKIVAPSGVEVMLKIRERVVEKVPDIIHQALAKVADMKRPDTLAGCDQDEILVDPLDQAKCAREVASGVFYKWIFPRNEPTELRDEWYAARKLWNSELRDKMLRGDVHLDSPKLCENAARRYHGDDEPNDDLPKWNARHWIRWREVKDLVIPETEAVRLHPFLVEDAARWGQDNTGIIWYANVEWAMWLAEISGMPMFEGGKKAAQAIVKERGTRSIIASIKSHGRGRDRLQLAFSKQLIGQMFASSRQAQQLLGRLHRRGQKALEVCTEVYLHVRELEKTFNQALLRGQFVEATVGDAQKLLEGWEGGLNDGDE